MKPTLYGGRSRNWGVGACAVFSAILPAGAAVEFGAIPLDRPPLSPPGLKATPAPVLTLDFTVSMPSAGDVVTPATLNVPKFGPNDFSSLGGDAGGYDLSAYRLESVELSFSATFMANIKGENEDAGQAVQFTYSLPLTSTFAYPNLESQVLVPTINSDAESPINLGASDGVLDYGGASGYTSPTGDSATESTGLFQAAPPASLTPYAGTGTWAVNISSVLGGLTTSPTANFKSGSSVPMFLGSARVRYTYLHVPETDTILAAAGLVAMVGYGRWRSSRRSRAAV